MRIDAGTVRRIAALARLRLAPEDEGRMIQELDAILSYVAQLEELDVSGIEPTSQVGTGVRMALRPDEDRACHVREEALEQAPDRDGDYFRVPRVV